MLEAVHVTQGMRTDGQSPRPRSTTLTDPVQAPGTDELMFKHVHKSFCGCGDLPAHAACVSRGAHLCIIYILEIYSLRVYMFSPKT
jgi:hypothetical protein